MRSMCGRLMPRRAKRRPGRRAGVGLLILAVAAGLGGCPTLTPTEYIAGSTGDRPNLASQASVAVYAPQGNLAVAGGTAVEVNWRAVGRTVVSTVDVILDPDTTPDSGNERIAYRNLSLSETSALINTTGISTGTYRVGVLIREAGVLVAHGYAAGAVTITAPPNLQYTMEPGDPSCYSTRDNPVFDRSARINPSFCVSWTLSGLENAVTTRVFLDPDSVVNGNEILLRISDSQTGDSFGFDLPTAEFEPGTYRIVAVVSDGVDSFPYYAPGAIRLRSRLAGPLDLRDMHLPEGGIRGAVFEGFNPRDNAGSFVSSIKDIDGDGYDDFIIMSQFGKPAYQTGVARTGIGEGYVIYGRATPFAGVINLNSTGTLFRGEIFGGVPEQVDPLRPSRGITSFALMSDWDGDGVRELAFGLPFTDSLSVGTLLSGSAPLDVNGYFRSGGVIVAAGSALRPDLGFPGRNVFNLAEFGTLAHLGIGCFNCAPDGGCTCPEGLYGRKVPDVPCASTYFNQNWVDSPGALNPGAIRLGCRFSSNDVNDQFGETVSSYDFDSILMSAPNRDPAVSIELIDSIPGAGVISLFFVDVKSGFYPWTNGNAPPASGVLDYPGSRESAGLGALPRGGPYHYIMDELVNFEFEFFAGQFTGSPGYWVDLDQAEPCGYYIDPRMSTPEYSVRFWSSAPGARLSNAKGIADINGDGLLDLVIGAPFAEGGAGACYIVLGRLRELVRGGALQLEELALPMDSPELSGRRVFDGIRIVGSPGERLGQSQDNAGDFNNDGFADVLIGSPLLNNRRGGAAVLFGSRELINLTQEEIPFDEIPARGLGVIFVGEAEGDLAGARVASAGDIDGDGNDDILIAAPNRSVRLDINLDGVVDIDRTECGVVYLIYGSPHLQGTIPLALVGTEALPGAVFIGRRSGDQLGAGLGEQGDRSWGICTAGDVDGDGYGDLLLGSVSASPRDRAQAGEAYLLYGAGD